MSQSIINPKAHRLAHRFVAQNWDVIGHACHDQNRSYLVFNVELWLVTVGGLAVKEHGTKRIERVRWLANTFYRNDFAHPSHDHQTRVDITQDIGYALLDYVGASAYELDLFNTWYDVVACARRCTEKYNQ